MMTLDMYLEDHGNAARPAKKVGVTEAVISRARHGFKVSFRTAMLIEYRTSGKVLAESLTDDVDALSAFRAMSVPA